MVDRVLIVEDEVKLAGLLRDYLVQENFEVTVLHRGDEVEPWMGTHQADLVLLDLMLPGKNGLDVCRALRATTDVAIIMVTARVDEIDRLLGLELGADDYICKPFSPREVVARVKAVLRRARPAEGVSFVHRLQIDAERHAAALDGHALDLTPVEFRLLAALAEEPVRILRRSELLGRLYTDHRVVTDRTVDSHVKNLRRKLAQAAGGRDLIRSIYGVGYKLDL